MFHANALPIFTGRLRLAGCVVEGDWMPRRVTQRVGVSATTVRKCVYRYRYRAPGEDGIATAPAARTTARPGRRGLGNDA